MKDIYHLSSCNTQHNNTGIRRYYGNKNVHINTENVLLGISEILKLLWLRIWQVLK